jgi:signal transduction histidine kinase
VKIIQCLDDIFHFKTFVFSLKKNELIYEPAFLNENDYQEICGTYVITREMEEKLRRSTVFSPDELYQKPPFLETKIADLVIPLVSDNQANGFFLCGQKKSERIYSRQDINVLTILARRVVALLHTATLYQMDLDRQLMLERERARIARDMHDDIGAGLTKIAMISEAPVINSEQGNGKNEKLVKIATTAREMIVRVNVIVWALNPKYDNLESLLSYLRRYFGEYLENLEIHFNTEVPDQIPKIPLSPDSRRNIFYTVQEAIHNAVKHAACSEICLSAKLLPSGISITITDNGKGFDQIKPGSGGNGLVNMKKRAEEMGGSFEIQSTRGIGTRIGLCFRL